jgi:hypothetical protein
MENVLVEAESKTSEVSNAMIKQREALIGIQVNLSRSISFVLEMRVHRSISSLIFTREIQSHDLLAVLASDMRTEM